MRNQKEKGNKKKWIAGKKTYGGNERVVPAKQRPGVGSKVGKRGGSIQRGGELSGTTTQRFSNGTYVQTEKRGA